MSEVEVRHDKDESRYEGWLGDRRAGFAEYRLSGEVITFFHTEVDEEFAGRGVASAIARHALDDVRADGIRRVVPRCPFFRRWIERHPEYHPLVQEDTP